jgi:hypothetical protein
MLSRRTFLATGVAGAAALASAGWVARVWRGADPDGHGLAPGSSTRAMLGAVTAAMLDGQLPDGELPQAQAIDATVDTIARAIAGLPDHARQELHQLFALLTLPPARLAFARLALPWDQAPPAAVHAFLERLRQSDRMLMRSAYDALHQLVLGSWYGQPRAWAGAGYPGPPRLGS